MKTEPASLVIEEFKKRQKVRVQWVDDSTNAGTSDDGSYAGEAEFVRYVNVGQVGDEMLTAGPHCVVKTSPGDHGSFFPISAITAI